MHRSYCVPVYPSKKLLGLPRLYELTKSIQLSVNRTQKDEVESLRELALDAAEKQDNVGSDEITECRNDIDLFAYGDFFTVNSIVENRKQIVGFFRLAPAFFSRVLHPYMATLNLFRRPTEDPKDEILLALFLIAEELTVELNIGYRVCAVNIALCCERWLRVARQSGFTIAVIVPSGVLIKDLGLVNDVVFVKNIHVESTQFYSIADVSALLEKFFPSQTVKEEFFKGDFSEISFLPESYQFKCGKKSLVRTVRLKDFDKIYELFAKSKSKNEGYFGYEYLTPYIVMETLMRNYVIVYEDSSNDDIMGFTTIGESFHSRSKSAKIIDSDVIVNEKYRDLKIGVEILYLNAGIAKQLGYKAIISNVLLSNARVLHMSRVNGQNMLGSLPGLYSDDVMWEDEVVILTDLNSDRYKTFSEWIDIDRKRENQSKL